MAIQASSSDELRAEINVTPLVDVVLVLLIIFLVVTPLLKEEVPIDLPVAAHSRSTQDPAQITLRLAEDGRTLLDGVEIPPGELVGRLSAIYASRAGRTIFLEADRGLPHGRVVDVMDDCRAAGIVQIGVITKKETQEAPAVAPPAADPSPGAAARASATAGAS